MTTPELVTPPAQPIVSLAEAKLHLRIDHEDDDWLVASLTQAATEWLEIATDRKFVAATYRLWLDGFDCDEIELPYPPLASVTFVKYLDSSNVLRTLATSAYEVNTRWTPGRVQLAYGGVWPTTGYASNAVQVQFVAGYGSAADVPELAKAAVKLLLGHLYENRETTAEKALTQVPFGVEAMVQSLRAYRF